MIKANELRTGNKVLVNRLEDDEPWETTVEEIGAMQITASLIPRGGTWVKYEDLEPIPLDPELLKRCGFVKDEHSLNRYTKGAYAIIMGSGGVSNAFCLINTGILATCKYLHQLQNLSFALTSEELTIKETV